MLRWSLGFSALDAIVRWSYASHAHGRPLPESSVRPSLNRHSCHDSISCHALSRQALPEPPAYVLGVDDLRHLDARPAYGENGRLALFPNRPFHLRKKARAYVGPAKVGFRAENPATRRSAPVALHDGVHPDLPEARGCGAARPALGTGRSGRRGSGAGAHARPLHRVLRGRAHRDARQPHWRGPVVLTHAP